MRVTRILDLIVIVLLAVVLLMPRPDVAKMDVSDEALAIFAKKKNLRLMVATEGMV